MVHPWLVELGLLEAWFFERLGSALQAAIRVRRRFRASRLGLAAGGPIGDQAMGEAIRMAAEGRRRSPVLITSMNRPSKTATISVASAEERCEGFKPA